MISSESGRPVTGRGGGRSPSASRFLRSGLTVLLVGLASVTASTALRVAPASAGAAPNWSQLSPTTSPPGRNDASMAYDPLIDRIVLFGGNGYESTLDDTWTFDGTTWTRVFPAASPQPRAGAAMAYDPAIGKVVLFSGADGSSNDTWTFDGTTWTQVAPAASPPSALADGSMVYDTKIGRLVLFGGIDFACGCDSNATWTFDGATWTRLSPSTSPSARSNASISYDSGLGEVVLFGGGPYDGGALGDTWTFDGTTWTEQSPSASPSARIGGAYVYDPPAVGRSVLFGGLGEQPCGCSDLWTYDASTSTWTQQSPGTSPPPRFDGSMVYDPAVGSVILFGGQDPVGNVPLGDTWSFGAAFQIVTAALPDATPGSPYAPVQLSALHVDASAGPYVTTLAWRKVDLPKGLRLSPTGVLSGTPSRSTVAGPSSVTVQATETVTTLNGKGKAVKSKTAIRATIPLNIA